MKPGVDSVAVSLRIIEEGSEVDGVVTTSSIPKYHKIAVRDIGADEPVFKYGQVIGYASKPIAAGDWVHTHNLHMGRLGEEQSAARATAAALPPISDRYFLGYRDAFGRAATRNYVLIASTVDCSAQTVDLAVRELEKRGDWYRKRFPNVDGIVGLTHDSGCGLVGLSPAHLRQNLTMRNLLDHPNVGGRVIVQLGCEKSQADLIVGKDKIVPLELGCAAPGHAAGGASSDRFPVLTMQERGGTWKSVEQIVRYVDEVLLPEANAKRRELIPASELVVASQCGGSDAASGFTANPAIGFASDLLVRCGAASFLSETSETFGAGHLITSRAASAEVVERYRRFVIDYTEYLAWGHGTAQNNLSHGNKLGGLTTIAEKSLGALAKAGSAPFSWIVDYAERVPGPGLGFMNGPAFDSSSATGEIAGGAQVGVFSTGRGSCFGGILTPWIKVVSNTETFERIDDMEVNAGRIADGSATIEDVGLEVFEMVLAVASGAKTYSEKAGYQVVNIWNSGAVT